MALLNDTQNSFLKYLATKKLLKRACQTDTQTEEFANFIQKSKELFEILNSSSKSNDNSTKILHENKNALRSIFLSGIRKKDITEKRKNHTSDLVKFSKIDLTKKLQEELKIKEKT